MGQAWDTLPLLACSRELVLPGLRNADQLVGSRIQTLIRPAWLRCLFLVQSAVG